MPETFDYTELPETYRNGIEAYLELGDLPDPYLLAVLKNDLASTVKFLGGSAFAPGVLELKSLCKWLHNEAPMSSWGSWETIENWMAHDRASYHAAQPR